MDPVDVRRKNLLAKFDTPHTTPMGQTYDCGDYEGALDRALEHAGYAALRAEQKQPSRRRRQQAARHRCQRVRRDHRWRPADERGRQDRDQSRRHGHDLHGHLAARSRARHGVVVDRQRPDRHRHRRLHVGVGRHRPHAGRRRHDGIAVAAAGRGRRARGGDRARREGQGASPPACSRPTSPTSCSTSRPGRSTSPAHRR